jgi:hypothetical protein
MTDLFYQISHRSSPPILSATACPPASTPREVDRMLDPQAVLNLGDVLDADINAASRGADLS